MVATDDERIEETCRRLGIACLRTGEHDTDRVAECVERLRADAYINVQGDEPFIAPAAIDAVSEELERLPSGTFAVNVYTELYDASAVLDHNVVKAVVGTEGNALTFSRQPIPYHGETARSACVNSVSMASRVRPSNASNSFRKARWSEPR